MAASKSLPRRIAFNYYDENDQEVTHDIRKLPLGRAVELSEAFSELPKAIKHLAEGDDTRALFGADVQNMDLLDMAVLIGNNLGQLLQIAQDAIVNILAVGSNLERSTIEQLGLDEASDLFYKIIQVNNLGAVQQNLKNGISLLFPQAAQKVEKKAKELTTTKPNGSKT